MNISSRRPPPVRRIVPGVVSFFGGKEKSYAAELVDVEGCEVGDVEWRVGGFSEARGEQDVRFILGDLGWGVC